jgi:hypothetical protein
MNPLAPTVSDADLIGYLDQWAALMEQQDYQAALAFVDHIPEMKWTPELLRLVVKSYGDADPKQRVTLNGVPTDVTQRKAVARWPINARQFIGYVWYDLNIDGKASDLTATFDLKLTECGVTICLNDIHVM